MSLQYEGEQQGYSGCHNGPYGGNPTDYYTKADIDALLAGFSASGIDETIDSLIGDGPLGAPGGLNAVVTSGSGAAVVGDRRAIDVASGLYAGVRFYLLITSAAAQNLPSIVRPSDWASSGLVWQERL